MMIMHAVMTETEFTELSAMSQQDLFLEILQLRDRVSELQDQLDFRDRRGDYSDDFSFS
jgi:hypothetical protein